MADKKNTAKVPTKDATAYTREALLSSAQFANVQRDFLAAILTKPTYTLDEARAAVNDFLKKE